MYRTFSDFRRALNYLIDERLDLENRDAQIVTNEHIAFIIPHSANWGLLLGLAGHDTAGPNDV